MAFQYFASLGIVDDRFPPSLAAMHENVGAKYESGRLLDVPFDERRAYNVHLGVFAVVDLGKLHGLVNHAHLNGETVRVGRVLPYCAQAEAGACTHGGACEYKVSLEVRLVNEKGVGRGRAFRVDSRRVEPHMGFDQEVAMQMLRGMMTLWTSATPVMMHFQRTQVEIMRFVAEGWNQDKVSVPQAPDVCHVVTVTCEVDLAGLVAYMARRANWRDTKDSEVVATLRSFVHARLSGAHLRDECVICYEPLRQLPQVRLGCACGAAGAPKGRVMHLKCAHSWLQSQTGIWKAAYSARDQAARGGPPAPTCPVCIQRLQGVPPRVSDIVGYEAGDDDVNIIKIPDNETSFHLFHMLDRNQLTLPDDLTRALGKSVSPRVDSSKRHGILLGHRCVEFPTAKELYLSTGHEPQREGHLPGPAALVASTEELQAIGVEKFNVKVYYAALGCWLRWRQQFERNGLAAA